MQDLKKFLVELPSLNGYRDDRTLKRAVFQALYFAATEEGKHLDLLFKAIDLQFNFDPWRISDNDEKPFYEYVVSENYTHPSNQVCGRTLQSNEKVYRCADCGYDDTCVMCSFCFKREFHEGHNVSVYLSQANGGMCDCGDDTAFVRPLDCACLSSDEAPQISPQFKSALRATIETVLDYVLDVTNYSINTLPFIHQNINGQGELELTTKDISNAGSLSKDMYGVDDVNSEDKWYLILWNDENHDYPEAETGIRAATGMDDRKAKYTANEINRKGRAILRESKDYTDLLESQNLAQADGLVATISSARDFIRESIIFQIFNWLEEIISFEGNTGFREASKHILAQVLLEPGFEFSKPMTFEFLKSVSSDLEGPCSMNGIPLEGDFLNPFNVSIDCEAKLESLSDSVKRIIIPNDGSGIVKSRILYLLAFEVRFVSVIRKRFTNSIIPVLFIDPSIKESFCDQYVNAYPMLMSILAFSDREEELASASEISVQLFTCPRTNKWIFKSGNLLKLLYPLCQLIEDESSLKNTDGFPNLVDIVFDIRSKREKSAIHNTIKTCIENVTRVVTKNDEVNQLNYFLARETLPLFLTFLRLFQGLSPVVRKYGDHVERESITEFYSFILKAVPVSSIVYHATRVVDLNLVSAKKATVPIFRYLESRTSLSGTSSFRVSRDPVSPFNPLNSFISFVLQETGVDAIQEFLCDSKNDFNSISDFSLRNIVLVSQVKIGLWIRNGISVARQVCYLLDSLADVNYSRDVHLNQIAAIVDQPEETMMHFIDRWELAEWFLGKVEFDQTVYEQKFSFICEKLTLFLYKLLVDRLNLDRLVTDVPKDDFISKSICYALCEEPQSYSKLKKLLPLYISKSENFDRILRECADYQPPVGLYDVGLYRLRSSLYQTLDPMGQVDGENSQSIFEALFANASKHNNCESKETILVPQISSSSSNFVNIKIGAIFRTKTFAKLMYKLLQLAISTGDEEYLPHLLHLLHAIILDCEQIFGADHLEKNLVAIPICNLLLTIAESTMSKPVTQKADFLLKQFVCRNGNVMESLVDCFGEAHIDSYRLREENLSDTKRQKSTKLAQNRKAKIMKKFAKQREKFLKGNDMFKDEETQVHMGSQVPILRNCVYCGEAESIEKPFGIPSVTSAASIFWGVSLQDPELVDLAFSDYSKTLSLEENGVYSKGFPKNLRSTSDVSSSCGHGIHIDCQNRTRILDTFLIPCSLCHNFYDDVIPSYLHYPDFFDPSILTGKPLVSDSETLVRSFNEHRNRQILHSVVLSGYFENDGSFRGELTTVLCSAFKISDQKTSLTFEDKNIDALERIETLIANTIKANEISMRVDEDDVQQLFMKETPASLESLIRSLIQSRVVLFETQKSFVREIYKRDKSRDTVAKDHDNGIFKEVVSLLFSSNESLQTIIRYGFAKLIAQTSITLCAEFDTFLLRAQLVSDCALHTELIDSAASYCDNFLGSLNIDFSSKSSSYFGNFFLALERCVLPFLRQCAILVDILLSKKSVESNYISNARLKALNEFCEPQNYRYSSSPLCLLLKLPKLVDILSISRLDNDLHFESKILQTHIKNWKGFATNSLRTLEYPNVPRLINLPNDFNTTITDPRHILPSDMICLLCGKKVLSWLKSSHHRECSPLSLLFCPEENSITTVLKLGHEPFEIKIPGPYMTAHGEVKEPSLKERATLNRLRYSNLNKIWINQELFGFATRTMYGERLRPLEDLQAETLEEESFEDFEFWE
ncbi:hypothetical protein METBIDRAFT_148750 [Metschnikowia bicuspidata var. bicuspidata NRRL YB-4993]|uniref:E3 ubiquitin-protein ligase n=1 Tax=Metschnikowia bicuspidata var. bicuspidata NRRL YB-4993 TaxID=869754 RepID=A0A1A0HDZ1_9ASCO|nr:hypothetical protein METBIDRAFT_148750 [Metschnikowia bicuspidata var. bicuspidata NRRL YB-4993]OBA22231.1 hypothetical protein METBIDRAFT_148750 [Metschnikowia bicuspidata var. bicuspidata NRRL YB-4993]